VNDAEEAAVSRGACVNFAAAPFIWRLAGRLGEGSLSAGVGCVEDLEDLVSEDRG
jgi:hypothetical protein